MKTFMIAFLCIWTSSAFAMTQDKSIINRSEVKTVQQRQHRELPPRHHSAMNDDEKAIPDVGVAERSLPLSDL